MKKMEPSYQRSMVIVHGLSEQSICSNIKSNLRLPQEIISRDNGRCSIQITSLMPLLNDSRFKDYKSFIRAFPKVEHAKNQLKNFQEYITIFPTSHGDLDITVAEKLYEKLKNCNCTNMDEYIKTCIENARANRCNR